MGLIYVDRLQNSINISNVIGFLAHMGVPIDNVILFNDFDNGIEEFSLTMLTTFDEQVGIVDIGTPNSLKNFRMLTKGVVSCKKHSPTVNDYLSNEKIAKCWVNPKGNTLDLKYFISLMDSKLSSEIRCVVDYILNHSEDSKNLQFLIPEDILLDSVDSLVTIDLLEEQEISLYSFKHELKSNIPEGGFERIWENPIYPQDVVFTMTPFDNGFLTLSDPYQFYL